MSYLTGQVTASASALFVICRYLATQSRGATVTGIQEVLAPAAVTGMGRAGRTSKVPSVLSDSLALGLDVGLLDREGDGESRLWSLRQEYLNTVKHIPSVDSRGFRSLLLQRFGMRALQAVESGSNPPDIPFGLTWLMTLDPMQSMDVDWEQGPSDAFEKAGMRSTVSNPEQWRPFLRWAQSLGLVNLTHALRKRRFCIDPTGAIQSVLHSLPQHSSAPEWLHRLHAEIPLLGDPRLVEKLPTSQVEIPFPSHATALALIKLDHIGRLKLIAADDTTDAVVLRVGSRTKRVAQIEVVEEPA
ncbi:hypothetical protein [Lentzea sp. NPDC055074]